MTTEDLWSFKQWFDAYVKAFYTDDSDIQLHVRLKEDHTARVCKHMTELAGTLNIDDNQKALANVVALFHDVGRFQQYTQYRTFNDFRSEDHASLGVRILQENRVLDALPPDEQILVKKAVCYHNGRGIPDDIAKAVQLARMIRDADKVDILAMVTSEKAELRMIPSPEFGAADAISPGIAEYILQGEVARFDQIRTTADQMLFRMSWVLDMNFAWTFRKIRQERYLEKMATHLPNNRCVQMVVDYLTEYRDRRTEEVE